MMLAEPALLFANPDRALPKPPPVVDGADDYEIERIFDHCDTARGRQYLVHWLEYPDTDDEWIHKRHIEVQELIDKYLEEIRGTEM
jgi:DNA mismatch repair ATPase MutS